MFVCVFVSSYKIRKKIEYANYINSLLRRVWGTFFSQAFFLESWLFKAISLFCSDNSKAKCGQEVKDLEIEILSYELENKIYQPHEGIIIEL